MYIKVRDYKRLVTEIRTFLEGYEATENLNRLGFIPSGEVNSLFISPLDALAIFFDDYGEEDMVDKEWYQIVTNNGLDIEQKLTLLLGLSNSNFVNEVSEDADF